MVLNKVFLELRFGGGTATRYLVPLRAAAATRRFLRLGVEQLACEASESYTEGSSSGKDDLMGEPTIARSLKRTTGAQGTAVRGGGGLSVSRAEMGRNKKASETGRCLGRGVCGGEEGVRVLGSVADELERSIGVGSAERRNGFLRG